ncbi:unnamed protein product [Agarophyton chilense]|eukprot:gb/GEZJ01002053.1/.p1 GENE.gb/GEZJ01002053.1/~~gb/GEZJ01002053.1/.p1  ORF type:complete len:564 (-),score=43.42 gb/GEZJ01002053.1/:652-2343(-)
MAVTLFVFAQILLVVLVRCTTLTCADHPVYSPTLNPVLVSSWTFLSGRNRTDAFYYPRYTGRRFAPVSDQKSTVYHGLDWFYASNYKQPVTDSFVRLNLHRDAKIYLIVGASYDRNYPPATLRDWNSEGWAERVDDFEDEFVYGVHQRDSKWLPNRAYIFSRGAKGSATLPSQAWIEDNISGVNAIGGWYAMIAQSDGTPSKPPAQPTGVTEAILPNQRCPNALHDTWVTPENDASDLDVSGKMWPTWHPQWDPCYWCAYDHEHGSATLPLMNYAPKFGYTPWKNENEDESHEGFKCAVFRSGAYYVCFCIHAQTSSVRRIGLRSHSIIFVVTDAATKELLVEVTHKGYFGFTGVRKRGGGFMGLTADEEDRRLALRADGHSTNKRSVNVIDVNALNPEYEYNDDLMRGRYEEWTTNAICSGHGHDGMLNMDIRNPITGIVSSARADEKVNLGSMKDGTLLRHDGSSKLVHFRDFQFGEDYCIFNLRDIHGGRSVNGTFYTDPTGKKLMSGPGKSNLRQFVKPGFKFQMTGHYDVVDPWGGELILDADAGQSSNGYGLDPNVN